MSKEELIKQIAELRATMCYEAGCKTNGENMAFLEDDMRGLNRRKRLKQFFKKFEDDKQGFNKVKRLNKISKESLKKLQELKKETEKLDMMKFSYLMNINYNTFFLGKINELYGSRLPTCNEVYEAIQDCKEKCRKIGVDIRGTEYIV
ncbi:hypothetical protein HBE96_17270 [Clostridium sp. P21]|uniref:Uncharacterized protein n=1 Tax=Clostridium muellerianum TaxID=2716538 RepID=A0A7Y0EJ17_9CLOT|nr:hypothetical protein [Clostridium muellerianum]NMM64373.1 hypothetical protein [Clostridium muellerianum]